MQNVCVGDGFSGESRVIRRWLGPYQQFASGFPEHRCMDQEMAESPGGATTLLKKFIKEGVIVSAYVNRFQGPALMKTSYNFENNQPLLAVGWVILVSHAEPQRFFSDDEIIGYRKKC